jgi:hydroxypyruvate isomerase
MPRFAANLTMLFNEVPFLDRFEACRPVLKRSNSYSLCLRGRRDPATPGNARPELVLHNLPAGDWDAGERGIAVPSRPRGRIPRRRGQSHRLCKSARRRPAQLPGRQGPARHGRGAAAPDLRCQPALRCSGELKKAGIRLLIEPINTFDIPGFYLNRTAQAIAILTMSGADNLSCSTTSTTPSAWRENWPRRCRNTCPHRPRPAGRQPGPQ